MNIKITLFKLIVLNFTLNNNIDNISLVHIKLNNVKLIYAYIYDKY